MLSDSRRENVDPQMPPERYSRRGAHEFDVESSLALQRESEGPKYGGDSAGNSAPLARAQKYFYIMT